jgi:hypothetical protein
MANEITWMKRSPTRGMPAMELGGAVLSDAITLSGSNQYVEVDGEAFPSPEGWVDGPMIRVSFDEDAYIVLSPAASGGTALAATAANIGVPVKAGQIEYFEIPAGWYVGVANAKS